MNTYFWFSAAGILLVKRVKRLIGGFAKFFYRSRIDGDSPPVLESRPSRPETVKDHRAKATTWTCEPASGNGAGLISTVPMSGPLPPQGSLPLWSTRTSHATPPPQGNREHDTTPPAIQMTHRARMGFATVNQLLHFDFGVQVELMRARINLHCQLLHESTVACRNISPF